MLHHKPICTPIKTIISSLVIVCMLLLSACSDHVQTDNAFVKPNVSSQITFSQADRAKVRRFSILNKPSGKRYKGEYHYKPNDRLPRFYPRLPLPPLLDRKLTPLPLGYTRIQIGDDYGIINNSTRVIYDMIYNVDP